MKRFAIVLTLVLVGLVAVHAVEDAEAKLQFTQWMKKHNKQYSSTEELSLRYNNFKNTLDRAALKNKQSKGAVYGATKFADLSVEEFRNTILMKNPIVVSEDNYPRPAHMVLPTVEVEEPAQLDWRDKGAVTPVKDQEQCGSCWAFSVTENIESMWILAGHGNNQTIDLAPQQIVDCDDSDAGCDGGDPPTAYEYVIGTGGLESNISYPYAGVDGNCRFQQSKVVATISSWKWATEYYFESSVKSALISWGPLSICVDAANWQDYQSGVMTWEECAFVNILDHCVQLVGYNTLAPVPYWIVRNSWNTDWGVEGYIYLEMGEDTCGLAHEASTSVV